MNFKINDYVNALRDLDAEVPRSSIGRVIDVVGERILVSFWNGNMKSQGNHSKRLWLKAGDVKLNLDVKG